MTRPMRPRVEALRARVVEALRPDSAFFRHAAVLGAARGPRAFLQLGPPAFAVAFAAALPAQREAVRANLRRVLGVRPRHVELVDIAAVFRNYAACLTETLIIGSGRTDLPLTRRSQGVGRYYACTAEGRGVIMATAHTGGWEVAGHVLSGVHQGEVVVAMQRERDPTARALQDEARARAGVRVVHIGESSFDALTLLGHLRRGAAVAIQIDRAPRGMRVRRGLLCGTPFQVPEGLLKLAAASGAPILPVFTRRVGFMDYEASVWQAVRVPRRASSDELDRAAQALLDSFGDYLVANPTQWFNFAHDDAATR